MRQGSGLAASPPVRRILVVGRKRIYSSFFICADGQADRTEHSGSAIFLIKIQQFLFAYPTATAVSTFTFRRKSAASSGITELMNIPEPSSNPAVRVSRGITLMYQWK